MNLKFFKNNRLPIYILHISKIRMYPQRGMDPNFENRKQLEVFYYYYYYLFPLLSEHYTVLDHKLIQNNVRFSVF